mgnify:CR=1 FL=1
MKFSIKFTRKEGTDGEVLDHWTEGFPFVSENLVFRSADPENRRSASCWQRC